MPACFFDLDNTLLDNMAEEVPSSALFGLEELRKRGTRVVLATGRDMDTHYSVRYRDLIGPDAIIHQNGTRISVGGRDIFIHFMDRGLLSELYEFCLGSGIALGCSIGSNDYYLYPELKRKADLSFRKRSVRNFVPFREVFERDIPISALSVAGEIGLIKPLLEERFPWLDVYPFPGDLGADIVEKGYSKADGMRRVCEYFGLDMADTYAFGDSANDVPMLIAAGTGIAVGGADEEAISAADLVTADIRHDGIYRALVQLGLIESYK